MNRVFSSKSPYQMVTMITITCMVLTAFLPLNFSLQTEATQYPFKLIITLEKIWYKLGEPVNVTWTLVNIGEKNVTLYYHSVGFLHDFIVYDENFNHVYQYRSQWLIPMDYYPHPFPPGDNITLIGSWEQVYDSSGYVMPYLWHKEVSPGTYYVFGIFSGNYRFTFRTPAIKITIM